MGSGTIRIGGGAEYSIHVGQELINVEKEIKRLETELLEKRKHQRMAQAKLANSDFVKRAPLEVVQQQRDLLAGIEKEIQAIERNLQELRQE